MRVTLDLVRAPGGRARNAEAWFAGLRADGRYLEDIWGETAVV